MMHALAEPCSSVGVPRGRFCDPAWMMLLSGAREAVLKRLAREVVRRELAGENVPVPTQREDDIRFLRGAIRRNLSVGSLRPDRLR